MRRIDETGNTYGKLEVIRLARSTPQGAYWLCRCECGREKEVLGASLRKGSTTSCGLCRSSIHPGDRHGRLTAVKALGGGAWLVRCDCGTEYKTKNFKQITKCRYCSYRGQVKDETGHTYGRLRVVRRCDPPSYYSDHQKAWWLCRCEACGSEIPVRGTELRLGRIYSCGCVKKKKDMEEGMRRNAETGKD